LTILLFSDNILDKELLAIGESNPAINILSIFKTTQAGFEAKEGVL
jgi:hypothetical protein